jgi:hypothetical protein
MFELQETTAVPVPVMLLGLIAPQVKPVGIVSVRLTDPAKWFTVVRVIVELAELPASTGAGVEADTVKSRNRKVAVALCTSTVLVPVIVAV